MMAPGVEEYINKYRGQVLAWKMAGAGGGGHLAVVYDGEKPEAGIPITIRRRGLE
jgi:hypothetical protein